MNLKPKTKVEDLLEKLTSFSRSKVLSEFESSRYLSQAKSLVNIDAAGSWHIRGLIYYYTNQLDNMHAAFRTALQLNSGSIVLSNAIACYMNLGCLHPAFHLFEENSEYFINIRDFDLIIKLHRLALNLYEINTIHRLVEILTPYNYIKEVSNILEIIDSEVKNINNKYLLQAGIDWSEANKIATQAIGVIRESKLRPNSLLEVDLLDGEIINSFYIYSDIDSILKANDLLFEKIYAQNLLDVWNKLMFIFICAETEESVRNVA